MKKRPPRLPWRLATLVGTLILLLVCVALPTPAAIAAGDAIVYAKQGDIYKADPSGANRQRLTSACGCGRPVLSPDGELVAFDDWQSIYLLDIDGLSPRRVIFSDATARPRNAAFLPEGRTLVFERGTSAGDTYTDLYKIGIDSSGLTRLTAFSGQESDPTVSAAGVISFYYQTSSGAQRLAMINSDGSGFHDFAPRGVSRPVAPAISPNGSQIAFSGWKSSKDVGKDTLQEIFLVSSAGGTVQQLTSNLYWDSNPAWTRDGSTIAFTVERRPPPPDLITSGPHDIWLVNPATGAQAPLIEDTWPGTDYPAYRQARPALTQVTAQQLLANYTPRLKYDSQEVYFADSAATITTNVGNGLKRSDGSTIQDSPFGLTMLGWPQYLGGTEAFDSDFLDERNDVYQSDAAFMHGDPLYGNRIYGRAKQDQTTGKWWLQYWLWYYYNPESLGGVGVHEGDWEMIQIGLDANGGPDVATYAQHNGGERCGWNVVEKFWSSSGYRTPVVYVANGSHASYFAAGSYDRFPLPTDEANGLSPNSTQPSMEAAISDAGPGWALWRGQWGASDGGGIPGGQPSPRGPSQQGSKWTDPSNWDGSVAQCGIAGGTAMASLRAHGRTTTRYRATASKFHAPSTPRVRAERVGGRVEVRYRFSKASSARPVRIMLTVHPAGKRYSPTGGVYRIFGQKGIRTIPLPVLGHEPYVLRASSVSNKGRRSRVITARVR